MTIDMNEILERMRKAQADSSMTVAELKPIIGEIFKKNGITECYVRYEGSGDSGGIEDIEIKTMEYNVFEALEGHASNVSAEVPERQEHWDTEKEKWIREVKLVNKRLSDLIEDFVSEIIAAHWPGYENNDGGDGEVTMRFNSAGDLVVGVQHKSYRIEYDLDDGVIDENGHLDQGTSIDDIEEVTHESPN